MINQQLIKTNILEIENFSHYSNKLFIYINGSISLISLTGIITLITHILFDINERWIFFLICHYLMSFFFLISNLITFIFSFSIFSLSLIYRPISISLFKMLK